MKKILLTFIFLSAFISSSWEQVADCNNAIPFCGSAALNFPSSTGESAPSGPNYGRLCNVPYPTWYYMQVGDGGLIQMNLNGVRTDGSALDVDFVMWGPFNNPTSGCASVMGGTAPIQSSYSASNDETIGIGTAGGSNNSSYDCSGVGATTPPVAQPDKYYIVLVTNYNNTAGNLTFNQTNIGNPGAGNTNCAITQPCEISDITATASCSGNGTVITGTVNAGTGMTTGDLVISSSCGTGTQSFAVNPTNFPSGYAVLNYSIPADLGTGQSCTVTAAFTDNQLCSNSIAITLPNCCSFPTPTISTTPATCTVAGTASISNYTTTNYPTGTTFTFSPTGPTIDASGNITGMVYGTNYTVLATNGSCSSTASVSFNISDKLEPNYTVSSTNPTTCSGTDGTITLTGLTPNTAYQVSYTKNGTTVGPTSMTADANGKIIINNLSAGTYADFNVGLSGCNKVVNTTQTLTEPTPPTVDDVTDQSLCAGDNSNAVTFNGSTGTTISWTNNTPSIGLGASGTGNIPSFTAVNNGTTPVTGTITVTATSPTAGCPAATQTFTITVKPKPTITLATSNTTICSGSNVTITPTSTPSVPSFTWTATNNGTTGATNGTGTVIANNLTTGTTSGTATYQVSGDLNGCTNNASVTITVNPTPVASGSATSICSGETTAIGLSSNLTGTTFTWTATPTNVQGASNGSGNSINQTLTSPTGGTVVYTVTPTVGQCPGTPISITATVNTLPTISISPSNPTICTGNNVSLSASGASTYSWSPTTDLNVSTGATVVAEPTVTTTYTVTGTTTSGCVNTAQTQITVNTYPTLTVTNDLSICLGDTATLTASGAVTYTWTPTNGLTTASGNTVNAFPTTTTTYLVSGTTNGCTTTEPIQVTVNDLPLITTTPDFTICAYHTVTLNASGAVSYQWDHNVVNGFSFIIDSTTTYTVIGTSALGCQGSAQTTITTIDSPNVMFTADTIAGCVPVHIAFQNHTTGAISYQWDFGNGQTSTAANPSLDYLQEGCYDVSLSALSTTGCSTQVAIPNMICVMPTPTASFVASSYNITNVINEVDFLNLSQNATSYEWQFGDETGFSNVEHPHYTYDPNIVRNYTVYLIAENDEGCKDTATTVISMSRETVMFVPTAFTPDGDQYNNVFKPIIVEGFDIQSYSLLIYDRWGELIFESHDPNLGWDGVYKVTGEIIPEGIYVWKIDLKVDKIDDKISKSGTLTLFR